MAYTIRNSLFVFLLCVSLVYASNTDTLTEGYAITGNATLISAGSKLELGFFTADGASDKSTYLGIWYYMSNPKIVTWVANRDRPLPNYDASFVIIGANAMVLDPSNVSYWSTRSDASSSSIQHFTVNQKVGSETRNSSRSPLKFVKLQDNGNLVFNDRGGDNRPSILWQSFDHPTDTFLPGMQRDTFTNLTSWRAPNDPTSGSYTFLRGQEQSADTQYIISKQGSTHYWEGGSSTVPPEMSALLLGNITLLAGDAIVRLVMSSNGKIQYWKLQNETRKWSIIWSEPRDRCSLYDPCGDYGSCNVKNGWLCKCLPGFQAQTPEEWDSGDFSDGCMRKSDNCRDKDPMLLKLPMMRVRNPDYNGANNEEDCRNLCVEDCCRAYSYHANGSSGQARCLIWSNDLVGVQEEYPLGHNLILRVSFSDIESTSRDCKPRGTYIIPYPLSTSPNCGDLMYTHFHYNTSTGQLEFQAPSGKFRVTAIEPDARKFIIQTKNKDCDSSNIQSLVSNVNKIFPFDVTKCNEVRSTDGSFIEIQMEWMPPPEPRCNSSRNCHSDWPDTTCKTASDGKNRCICGGKLKWNSSQLNCTSGYDEFRKEGWRRHRGTFYQLGEHISCY